VLSRGKKTSALDFARRGLVDAYEKLRDYKTAADLLEKIIATFVLPRGDKWRTAEDERLLYLRYTTAGEYDLAIKHAQKALEADAQLPNRPQGANPQYYERLNDLKAAKDYILSLKKK
jgi:tetratricopeptide (TPR) repeat protein